MASVIQIITSSELRRNTSLKKRLFNRSFMNYRQVIAEIEPSMSAVKKMGDQAILRKYQKREIPITQLLVTQQEITQAYSQVSKDYLNALDFASRNVRQVCIDQMKSLANSAPTYLMNKQVKIWRRWLPILNVGIYAPGGNANYPSSVMMSVVPAQVAGVKNLVLTVPPKVDGSLPPEVIVTADILGITQIYKVGGAQAIAALAYGTQSIPKVDLVVGPGNQYVTAAKIALFPQIQIDMPAGPSENVIIADDSANPRWVAADLITDCEHGVDSTGLVFTPNLQFAQQVKQEIIQQLKLLPTRKTVISAFGQYGAIIVTKNIEEAVALTNEYAPEHLQIMTKRPTIVAQKTINAGSVFIGPYSAKSIGDYCSGANHILPTGGSAQQFGPVSVVTFGRWQEFQQVSQRGFKVLAQTAQTFAQVECLPAHNMSAAIRLEKQGSE